MNPLWYVIGALVVAWGGLHWYTRGRSSPAAALGFVLGGPALGVLLLVGPVIQERRRAAIGLERPREVVFGLTLGEYAQMMLAVGLAAGVASGALFAWIKRDEFARFFGRRAAAEGPSPAPAALAALGLTAVATVEEVEQAYRRRALELHPDRRGDAAAFKRLQRHYEDAQRIVRRRSPGGK